MAESGEANDQIISEHVAAVPDMRKVASRNHKNRKRTAVL